MSRITYEVRGGDRIVVGIKQRVEHLASMSVLMQKAAGFVYAGTEEWFNSEGEGSWPQLADTTIAKKSSQGSMEPSRPLFDSGNLYESVISPHGPYSYMVPMFDGVVLGITWQTPATALARGTTRSGAGHNTVIPARPIWPPADSAIGMALMYKIGQLILKGI